MTDEVNIWWKEGNLLRGCGHQTYACETPVYARVHLPKESTCAAVGSFERELAAPRVHPPSSSYSGSLPEFLHS